MDTSRPPDLERPPPVEAVDEPELAIPSAHERRETGWTRWSLPVALFAATALSTLFSGAFWAGSPYVISDLPLLLAHPEMLRAHMAAGVPFCATLLAILVAHEFGHFFTAKAHRVDASPPYFIPLPLLIGTMGAVIRMRGSIRSRAALVDIGASGPIAGFVVAVPLLLWGLSLSEVQPYVAPEGGGWPTLSLVGLVQSFSQGSGPPAQAAIVPGTSLMLWAAQQLAVGPLPPGHTLVPHPMAMAAWFGLFVTALNMLPVGQLDGGHVLYAMWGRRARRVGRLTIALLVVLGVVAWNGWLLWGLLAWKVIRTTHPPVDAPDEPLGPGRRIVCAVALAILVATFVPVPIELR